MIKKRQLELVQKLSRDLCSRNTIKSSHKKIKQKDGKMKISEGSINNRLLMLTLAYLLLLTYSAYIHIDILNVRLGIFMAVVGYSPSSSHAIPWMLHYVFGLLYLGLAWLVIDSFCKNGCLRNRIMSLLIGVAFPLVSLFLGPMLLSPEPLLYWLVLFSIATAVPIIACTTTRARTRSASLESV